MVKLDEETRKALLLFNRRAEAAESEAVEDKRLAKAAKAKDDAARALKKAQDAGAEADVIAEADTAYRAALKTWQDLRDGVEPEEPEEPANESEEPANESEEPANESEEPANESEEPANESSESTESNDDKQSSDSE
mgnify:FL=1